jgi:general secretion pathway protein D
MKSITRSCIPFIILLAWTGVCLFHGPAAAQTPAGQPLSASDSPSASNAQLVSIDFNNVDISVFIKFISDLTKRNFIVDDKVRGKVTIISPGKITVQEAYRVFESVLEVYGFATVQSGQITKIIPSPDARSKNIRTRLQEESGSSDDGIVTQIIPLRYADPNEVRNLFAPLISRNSVILAYPPTNTLIVTDVSSNIQRLLKILKAIDTTGVGQQIAIIPVENAGAAKLVTLLESIFKSPKKGKGAAEKDITFVADERTNVIVVLASEGDVDNVRQLVRTLDRETPKGQGNINVYYLEHASAEELAKVLQDIPQKGTEGKAGDKPSAPVVSNQVRISADKATNSLIITADLDDYLVLESIIKKIDIPRAMVYIEALIMEVNAAKDFRLGTEWTVGEQGSHDGREFIYGSGFKGDAPLIGGSMLSGALVPSLPGGFSLGVFGEALEIAGIRFPSISAVINAYKKDRDVRILSTPQILTTDNQEAKIYVGKNVPFQTTATMSTASAGEVYNSYEYRDVGKTLKITPQISKDRMVRLTLSLEVTSLESAAENRPTTLKRTVDTTALVMDGHTVVLGGLIDDYSGESVIKVPCLGEVPGFGNLFRTKSTAFERSNLYVFLSPKVIQNSNEASNVYSSKRGHIDSFAGANINLYDRKNTTMPLDELRIPAPQDQTRNPMPENDRQLRQEPASPENSSVHVQPRNETATVAPPVPINEKQPVAPTHASTSQTDGDGPENDQAGGVGYTLQVASVQTAEKADQMIVQLIDKGYAAYAVRAEVNGITMYRIRIGYFSAKTQAAPVIERLKADQFNPIFIKL